MSPLACGHVTRLFVSVPAVASMWLSPLPPIISFVWSRYYLSTTKRVVRLCCFFSARRRTEVCSHLLASLWWPPLCRGRIYLPRLRVRLPSSFWNTTGKHWDQMCVSEVFVNCLPAPWRALCGLGFFCIRGASWVGSSPTPNFVSFFCPLLQTDTPVCLLFRWLPRGGRERGGGRGKKKETPSPSPPLLSSLPRKQTDRPCPLPLPPLRRRPTL